MIKVCHICKENIYSNNHQICKTKCCNSIYHLDCILEWYNTNRKCSVCQKILNSDNNIITTYQFIDYDKIEIKSGNLCYNDHHITIYTESEETPIIISNADLFRSHKSKQCKFLCLLISISCVFGLLMFIIPGIVSGQLINNNT